MLFWAKIDKHIIHLSIFLIFLKQP